jgi:hypothetical protein
MYHINAITNSKIWALTSLVICNWKLFLLKPLVSKKCCLNTVLHSAALKIKKSALYYWYFKQIILLWRKKEATASSVRSVALPDYMGNIPDNSNLHSHFHENLKSYMYNIAWYVDMYSTHIDWYEKFQVWHFTLKVISQYLKVFHFCNLLF